MTKGQAGLGILTCTVVWGLTFPIRQNAMAAGISPTALIFYASVICLIVCLICFRKEHKRAQKAHWKLGLVIGLFVAGGIFLQTIGLAYTTPSNSAFFTVTNVIMVPFVVWAMYRQKPVKKVILCVPLCILGVMVLSGLLQTGLTFNAGDVLTLLSALCMAFMITLLSKTPKGMHYQISVTCAALMQSAVSGIVLLATQDFVITATDPAWVIIGVLFMAIPQMFLMNCLQYKAQQYIDATPAALIMTMESVFGTVFSVLFGIEAFTLTMLVGGALIIASVVIMQVNLSARSLRRASERIS